MNSTPPPETMKVLKPRAQVGEQLEHRLVDQLGVRALKFRMAGGGDPVGDNRRELVGRHAGMGRRHDLEQPLLAGRRERLPVALEHRLERLGLLPFGMLRRHRPYPVEREGELEVDRLLGPERAVIVEVAMRCSIGMNSGPPSSVTRSTNATIARLALPSFQDGSGSGAGDCA
jgi:hypothetical protein